MFSGNKVVEAVCSKWAAIHEI